MYSLETEWVLRDRGARDAPTVDAPDSDGLSGLVAQLLRQRGFLSPSEIDRFLHPRLEDLTDPFLLPETKPAVDRLLRAVDQGEDVVIYGDYDVDGVTSIALFKAVLAAYGLKDCRTFLPRRMEEGYGLSLEGLERCLELGKPGLLIAVDCGTSSVEEADWLKERGVDLIICDHHECSTSRRPDCAALVNPKLGRDYHYLCSVGIVFKLAHALLKTRWLDDFHLRDYLDIVALGTVADIVPLIDENRLLVRKGLRQLERTQNIGLAALKAVAGLERTLTSFDIGFRLGPRLNAAGRLDTAQDALDLLLTEDPLEARNIAMRLEQSNRERQKVELRIHKEAGELIEEEFRHGADAAIVVGSRNWHPGVIGIVASRIVRRHHRPTFVIAFDERGIGKGSGRSVLGVSLVEAIDACRDLLLKGGGHEMAAGLTIEERKFPEFRARFASHIGETVSADTLRPRLYLDAEARFEDLTLDLLDSYELLQPFGSNNEQPLFLCRGVQLIEEPRVLKGNHLKLQLQQNGVRRDAIYFGGGDIDLPRPPWDMAFTIDRNVYRGRASLNISIRAVRKAVE